MSLEDPQPATPRLRLVGLVWGVVGVAALLGGAVASVLAVVVFGIVALALGIGIHLLQSARDRSAEETSRTLAGEPVAPIHAPARGAPDDEPAPDDGPPPEGGPPPDADPDRSEVDPSGDAPAETVRLHRPDDDSGEGASGADGSEGGGSGASTRSEVDEPRTPTSEVVDDPGDLPPSGRRG